MSSLKPYIGVIVAGSFILAFSAITAIGGVVDTASANLVIGVALGGGVGVDAGRKLGRDSIGG